MKKHIIILYILLVIVNVNYAHEPLYGLGPETLPKHLHAIEFGTHFQSGELEYELGYGFGINRNWTVRLDIPMIDNENNFSLGNVKLRTKYALWRGISPGILKRLTAVAAVKFPTADRTLGVPNLTAYTLGIANGYESRRWYYFSDVGYTFLQSREDFNPGGKLKYNLVGGIRPVKTEYLQPDLVLLVELNGELSGKSQSMGNDIQQSGGNTLAVAPGFLLSYRNLMLKAGMQFGVANTQYVNKPVTNGLVTLEYHF